MDINESEATTIENFIQKVLDALSEDDSPDAQALKQQGIEAQQIISAKLDQTNPVTADSVSGPTGGAAYPPMMDPEEMKKKQMMGAMADGEMSMEEFKAIGMHLQEAMNIIQKVVGSSPSDSKPIPQEAS